MSGNFAIKGGGGGRTPNGKCHLKFPFWFFAPLPYQNGGGVDDNCSVFLLKVFDKDGHGWINTPELQEVRMTMKFPKKQESPYIYPHE